MTPLEYTLPGNARAAATLNANYAHQPLDEHAERAHRQEMQRRCRIYVPRIAYGAVGSYISPYQHNSKYERVSGTRLGIKVNNFSFCDYKVRSDYNSALNAVRLDGYNLIYVAEALQADRSIVLAAVLCSGPDVMHCAANKLQEDLWILLAAVIADSKYVVGCIHLATTFLRDRGAADPEDCVGGQGEYVYCLHPDCVESLETFADQEELTAHQQTNHQLKPP